MSKRPVSIRHVAESAGVSTATVSNVFSGKKPVNPKLAKKVYEAAKELGFRINRSASNLRSGESRVIAMLVPDLSDPFFTSLATGLESRAGGEGYDLIIANARDDLDVQRQRINALLAWRPAGMVVIPCTDQIPEQIESARDECAIVIVDRGADARGLDSVRIDNVDAGNIAGRHLAELGHRDVLIVASDLGLKAISQRCSGALHALEAVGAHVEVLEVGPVPARATETLVRWLERNPVPTAIIAMTDMTTLGTLSALADRQLEVGSDVSVIGFDDYPWMTARRTPISVVNQPVEQIVDGIWTTLFGRLSGDTGPAKALELQCGLAVRASTRRIAPREQVSGQRKPTRKSGRRRATTARREPLH